MATLIATNDWGVGMTHGLTYGYDAFPNPQRLWDHWDRRFAERIDRDPGIVLGRLQNDQIVPFTNVALSKALKHKYKVITS